HEDPITAYKRIAGLSQDQFNAEVWVFTTLNFSGISTNISNKSFEYGEVQSSILSGDNFSKQNT
ncbi:hypothetical protein PN652_15775, partial [Odoribacter splanchnicus]|uniref:hypothetical protein n=1 Tax=Odoribacter splanchnicus TaxID=28118 RepID=UPI0023310557